MLSDENLIGQIILRCGEAPQPIVQSEKTRRIGGDFARWFGAVAD
jgi:hypothetical protein